MTVTVHRGDCLEVLPRLAPVDAVVTDPPYGLEFMGKEWDRFASYPAWCQAWAEAVYRVLRPGGYMLVCGSTRTYHRMACAIEDAGFVVQDCLMWLFGQGFPKSRNLLKPAYEPILMVYKPGRRALQVDEGRVPTDEVLAVDGAHKLWSHYRDGKEPRADHFYTASPYGRWPANIVHDGETLDGVGRFFYTAKAGPADRFKSKHPTVKPIALACWLVKLVTPPGGTVLDPFAGSGTTGAAALLTARNAVLIERDPDSLKDIDRRLAQYRNNFITRDIVDQPVKRPRG